MHGAAALPLSVQRNVAVGSGEVNVNVEVVELLSAAGLPVTWVTGGVRSTFHVEEIGGGGVPVSAFSFTTSV